MGERNAVMVECRQTSYWLRAFALTVALACLLVPLRAQFEAPPQAVPVQDAVRFEVSEKLFTAMAAINAAGYDEDLNSPSNHPVRAYVRKVIAAKKLPVVEDIRKFYEDHRRDNWQQELSQYISFAMVNEGPPDFNPMFIWNEMPPDAVELRGFEAYMKLFYEEANIGELWLEIEPQFEPLLAKYQPQVADTILKANAYLRNPTSGVSRSSFQIVLDLMGAPNHVETRAYDNMSLVVITPTPEFPRERVQIAYLHYLIDPEAYRYRELLEEKRALMDFAAGAPLLSPAYKEDFVLLASASLVRAVAARLDPMPTAEREARVQKALEEGFILTPFFYEQLAAFEKQPANMRFYLEEMIAKLDVYKENERLKTVKFRDDPTRRVVREAQVVQLTDLQKKLEEAEELLYEKKDFAGAKALYMEISRNQQNRTMQSRAFFGLGRVAVLERDPELAIQLFERALEFSPDPSTQSWSLIYLGRLADVEGDSAKAEAFFEKALQVAGLTRAAKTAAEKGLEQARKRRQ